MRREMERMLVVAGLLLVSACVNVKENLLFVTSTEIDIGYDAQIGNINIGYDRNEFMAGPQYVETGGTPPVAASIASNLSILSPHVSQVYATGEAAKIAVGHDPDTENTISDADDLSGKRRALYFGTSSSFGLNLTATQGLPSSLSLGYKRKEFSIIPLRKESDRIEANPKDKYGSVLASIDLNSTVNGPLDTNVELEQFFATGSAAEKLAENDDIRKSFVTLAVIGAENAAMAAGAEFAKATREKVLKISRCVQEPAGTFDSSAKSRLDKLVNSAGITGVKATNLKATTSNNALESLLQGTIISAINPMAEATSKANADCDA